MLSNLQLARTLAARCITRIRYPQLLPSPKLNSTLLASKPALLARRTISTSPSLPNKYTMCKLSDHEYYKISSTSLEDLTEYLEDIGDNLDMESYDIEYSSGVLTLKLGVKGTYVINKQPPNKQIWISSPFSGPERYDYDAEHESWFCRHTDETLGTLLDRELTEALDMAIKVPIK